MNCDHRRFGPPERLPSRRRSGRRYPTWCRSFHHRKAIPIRGGHRRKRHRQSKCLLWCRSRRHRMTVPRSESAGTIPNCPPRKNRRCRGRDRRSRRDRGGRCRWPTRSYRPCKRRGRRTRGRPFPTRVRRSARLSWSCRAGTGRRRGELQVEGKKVASRDSPLAMD